MVDGPSSAASIVKSFRSFFFSVSFVIVAAAHAVCDFCVHDDYLCCWLGNYNNMVSVSNWMGWSRRRPSNFFIVSSRVFPHLNWSTKSHLTQMRQCLVPFTANSTIKRPAVDSRQCSNNNEQSHCNKCVAQIIALAFCGSEAALGLDAGGMSRRLN